MLKIQSHEWQCEPCHSKVREGETSELQARDRVCLKKEDVLDVVLCVFDARTREAKAMDLCGDT